MLTKREDGPSLNKQLSWTSQVITSGTHEKAPKLADFDPLEEGSEEEDA